MSENNQNENRTFQTSSRSRKRVKRQKSWLIIPLTLLLLLIVAALFFVVRYAIRRFGGTPTESTPIETTSAPEQTQPSGSTRERPTARSSPSRWKPTTAFTPSSAI